MAEYTAQVLWSRGDQDFLDNRYSRAHVLRFDGGIDVRGSSSPHVVRIPLSDPAAVDPEEMLVAALSSCHMLVFLSIAAGRGFRIDRYADAAVGRMRNNAQGKLWIAEVILRPDVAFSGGKVPARDEVDAMHELAHAGCFIANSVMTEVRCEPV